jgi:hypothetical protein
LLQGASIKGKREVPLVLMGKGDRMRENRKMQRFELVLPAKVETVQPNLKDTEVREFLTDNVSAGGAFFHTDMPLPAGTAVKIDLILPLDKLKKISGKKAYIKVFGKVLRSDGKGMAVQFNKRYEIISL